VREAVAAAVAPEAVAAAVAPPPSMAPLALADGSLLFTSQLLSAWAPQLSQPVPLQALAAPQPAAVAAAASAQVVVSAPGEGSPTHLCER
jgi:hypothetical protein